MVCPLLAASGYPNTVENRSGLPAEEAVVADFTVGKAGVVFAFGPVFRSFMAHAEA